MYGILDRYVGKNIIMAVLLVAVCMTLFAGLITFIDALRYIGRGSIDFLFVVKYVMHKIPGICVTFFPVSILIGGVVGLSFFQTFNTGFSDVPRCDKIGLPHCQSDHIGHTVQKVKKFSYS